MKSLAPCAALFAFVTSVSAEVKETTVAHIQPASKIASVGSNVDSVDNGKADRIVVYSASWCIPCQRLKPIVKSLKQEGYRVEYFDIDKDSDKLKYDHRAVPTIYFLRGETVVKKETGYRTREHIVELLRLNPDHGQVEFDPETEPTGSAAKSLGGVGHF